MGILPYAGASVPLVTTTIGNPLDRYQNCHFRNTTSAIAGKTWVFLGIFS
jgi:hypothetical protein